MPEEQATEEIGLGSAEPTPGDDQPVEREPVFAPSQEEEAPSGDAAEEDDGSADTFDWEQTDLRRTPSEEVPETYRPLYERFQKEVKTLEADRTRKDQDYSARERRLEDQQRRIDEQLSEIRSGIQETQAQPSVQQDQQTGQRIRELLDDPTLDPDVRSSLMLIDQEMDSRIREALEPYRPLAEEFGQVRDTVSTLSQSQTDAKQKEFWNQVTEAQGQYADLDQYTDFITRGMGVVLERQNGQTMVTQVSPPLSNPATGKPHTVDTLYRLAAGLTAQEATAARDEDAGIKRTTKARAAATPTASKPASGRMTDEEYQAEVKKLFQA